MSPLDILGFCFAAVLLAVALPWVFSRRKAEGLIIRDFEDIRDGHHYRDGGTFGFAGPADRTLGSGKPPARSVGRHPALGAPYARKTAITLTPRDLERINTQRKLRNRPPLNRAGFASAISTASVEERTLANRQPQSSSDWFAYLILYECFFADHQSPTVACGGYVTIDPGQPYNGQGGDYSGAGASGDWTRPDSLTALQADVAARPANPETGSYQPGDTVGGYGALSDPNSFKGSSDDAPRNVADPGPIPGGDGGYPQSSPASSDGPGPSYSAPSPSSDSSSSYSSSSDSSSSSSSDSGSSSGGGGD